jgi:hypothetical protein
MAKLKGARKMMGQPGGGVGGNMAGMADQLRRMQEEMVKTQEALGSEKLTVSSGGGAVEIVITGHQRVESIKIDPEAVDLQDISMLEDLILTAVNQAIERSQAMGAERMQSLTSGINIPGLGF